MTLSVLVEAGVTMQLIDIDTPEAMTRADRCGYQNPRLRAVEQTIAEVAYVLRQYAAPGSPEYWHCTDAIRGRCSVHTLAVLIDLDAKSGLRLLSARLDGATGTDMEPHRRPLPPTVES